MEGSTGHLKNGKRHVSLQDHIRCREFFLLWLIHPKVALKAAYYDFDLSTRAVEADTVLVVLFVCPYAGSPEFLYLKYGHLINFNS